MRERGRAIGPMALGASHSIIAEKHLDCHRNRWIWIWQELQPFELEPKWSTSPRQQMDSSAAIVLMRSLVARCRCLLAVARCR